MVHRLVIAVLAWAICQGSFAEEIRVHFTDEAAPRTVSADKIDKRYGRYCLPDHQRAGWPRCISALSRPSVCADYAVGYVGGGIPWLGQPRYCHEGTIGLDYQGWFFSRKTFLAWSHGRRYQGGAGKYETDGPKFIE